MKLLAFEWSPLKIVGSTPMGFLSGWAAACAFPPLPGGPPPLPGGPPPPLPDGSVLPVKALGCRWVVMAMVINIFVSVFSRGWGAAGITGTVVDRLIGDCQICSSVGSSSLLSELVMNSGKMGMSLYLCGAHPWVVPLWLSRSGNGNPKVKYIPLLSQWDRNHSWFLKCTDQTWSLLVWIALVGYKTRFHLPNRLLCFVVLHFDWLMLVWIIFFRGPWW